MAKVKQVPLRERLEGAITVWKNLLRDCKRDQDLALVVNVPRLKKSIRDAETKLATLEGPTTEQREQAKQKEIDHQIRCGLNPKTARMLVEANIAQYGPNAYDYLIGEKS